LNEEGQLIGMIYQNLKFDGKNPVILSNYSFGVGKSLLQEIYKNINNIETLRDSWIFKPINDSKFKNLFTWEDKILRANNTKCNIIRNNNAKF